MEKKKKGEKKQNKKLDLSKQIPLKKYVLWAIAILLVAISFFLIKPFVIPLISAFVLAYLTLPLYKFFNRKISPVWSALACILLVILIILLPLGGIIAGITTQAADFIQGQNFANLKGISQTPIIQRLHLDLEQVTQQGTNLLINLLTQTAKKLPSIILSLFIILIGMYYILINWKYLSENLKKYLPFKDKEKVSGDISSATKQIIYGSLLVSLIGFIISWLGFTLLGIGHALFYSAIIAIFLFLPLLGPVLLWVPLAIYYFLIGQYGIAIGVTILGLIISNIVDNLIRMKILGAKTNINPLIMLVGILGGVATFGIFGFIIGPLILIYTIKLIQEIIN